MEIETPVLLAYAIEDSTDIFRISGGGGFEHPKPPSLGTPLPGRRKSPLRNFCLKVTCQTVQFTFMTAQRESKGNLELYIFLTSALYRGWLANFTLRRPYPRE